MTKRPTPTTITMTRITSRLTLLTAYLALALPAEGQSWFGSSSSGADAADNACNLYLAPSPLFGDNLGIYSTQPLEVGSIIEGASDIVIPLVEGYDPLWSHNDWSHMTANVEWEGRMVPSLLIGVGSASTINRNVNVFNVVPASVSGQEEDSIVGSLHRKKDAGTGAFAYQNMQYKVTAPIPAGGQLILNTMDEEAYALTPSDRKKLVATVEHTQNMIKDQGPEVVRDLIRFIRSTLDPPLRDYFPANVEQLKRASEVGVDEVWRVEDLKVDLGYLKEKGACLDYMKIAKSRIPQAGRGAFAKQSLPGGTVVTPVPVIPVHRDDLGLNFVDQGEPEEETEEEGKYSDGDQNAEDDEDAESSYDAWQLLLNYCIGHEDSSVLLCPYGSMFPYVNHGTGKSANVRLQWSTSMAMVSKHKVWKKWLVGELLDHPRAGLVLDLVATREIRSGEEVLLDYGDVWDEAWNDHVSSYSAPEGASSYQSASQMNRAAAGGKGTLKTVEEQMAAPYPSNIYVGMRYMYDPTVKPVSNHNDEAMNFTIKTYAFEKDSQESEKAVIRPVSVQKRQSSSFAGAGDDTYTVKLHNPHDERGDPLDLIPPDSLEVVIEEVPRSALFFVDGMFSSDHYLTSVFREEIGAPDGLYPETWLNLSNDYMEDDADDEPDL